MKHVVALFGEAEKGQFKKPYILRELSQLIDLLGSPPPETLGLFFAIQALLYKRELIYFRVQEEGFSRADYFNGFTTLKNVKQIHALCLPGVGDTEILTACQELCEIHSSPLISSEKDLYDYFTSGS